MPIELARADIEVTVNGRTFAVDAYEADIELGKIDARHPEATAAAQEARWQEVADYVNRLMKLSWWWWHRKQRCTIKQAINFYRGVQDALKQIAEEDAKRAHPFAGSPTGTDSTPAISENGNGQPTSPTLTASMPSAS